MTEALALQQDLLAEWEKSGEEEQDGYVFEEIAECLLALERTSESRLYFTQAYTLLVRDPWLVAEQDDRLQRLKRLADE